MTEIKFLGTIPEWWISGFRNASKNFGRCAFPQWCRLAVELTCFSRDMASQPMRTGCSRLHYLLLCKPYDRTGTQQQLRTVLACPGERIFFHSFSVCTAAIITCECTSLCPLQWITDDSVLDRSWKTNFITYSRSAIPASPSLRVTQENTRKCSSLRLRGPAVTAHTFCLPSHPEFGPLWAVCVCLRSPPNGLLSKSPAKEARALLLTVSSWRYNAKCCIALLKIFLSLMMMKLLS